MKNRMKTFAILTLIAAMTLFAAGCAVSGSQEASANTLPAESAASNILPSTDTVLAEDIMLFDTIFVPTVQGKISTEKGAFQEAVAAYGFKCYDEAGVILVEDPALPGCFIRGEMSNGKEIDALVYSCLLGNIQKQTRAAGINTGTPVYFTDVTNYKPGTQVQSLEDVRTYLNTDTALEETVKSEQETEIPLFEDIFLPLVNGELENSGRAIQAIVGQKGYYYVNGEGTFVIHDDLHPANYLYGDPMLLNDTDSVSILGFHLESDTEAREVEIHLFTSPAEYYICDPRTGNTTQVNTLEDLKNHIYQ